MHADGVDWMLMGLGLFGAVADGFITPIYLLIIGLLLNDLGGSSSDRTFMKAISKVLFSLCFLVYSATRHDKVDQNLRVT